LSVIGNPSIPVLVLKLSIAKHTFVEFMTPEVEGPALNEEIACSLFKKRCESNHAALFE